MAGGLANLHNEKSISSSPDKMLLGLTRGGKL
jgi:hypothetical protein